MRGDRKSYPQYCAIARGLEVIGQRWTLLIIRELLLGPKRYTDLVDGLPGIPTNLLIERLRDLEKRGVVAKRTLPPPAGSAVYELTDLGKQLELMMLELGRWGANFLGSPRRDDEFRPGWYVVSMLATFRAEDAGDLHETYEFRIDGDVFEIRVENGQVEARQSEARDPDLVVTTDLDTLLALLSGSLAPAAPVSEGLVALDGDQAIFTSCIELLRWPTPARV